MTKETKLNNALNDIEALTDWCRGITAPPPASLLYRAAAAVDVVRELTRDEPVLAEVG